jgi:hypothetical protein
VAPASWSQQLLLYMMLFHLKKAFAVHLPQPWCWKLLALVAAKLTRSCPYDRGCPAIAARKIVEWQYVTCAARCQAVLVDTLSMPQQQAVAALTKLLQSEAMLAPTKCMHNTTLLKTHRTPHMSQSACT